MSETKMDTNNECFFGLYSDVRIHEIMLKDEARTCAYRQAIVENKHMFKDKVVCDMGCGTGILSLFAAKAGARKVYAIEGSDLADQAEENFKANKLDHVITIVRGMMEDVTLPEKVHILMSEWMGQCAVHENMLESFFFARDKWLLPGGHLFPDRCGLYICGASIPEYRKNYIDCWNNVHGFDFSPLKERRIEEISMSVVPKESIVTDVCTILDTSLHGIKNPALIENLSFHITVQEDVVMHGLELHFDVTFSSCHTKPCLSTAPDVKLTPTWKQTMFHFDEPLTVEKGDTLTGTVKTFDCKAFERDQIYTLEFTVKTKTKEFNKKMERMMSIYNIYEEQKVWVRRGKLDYLTNHYNDDQVVVIKRI